MSFHIGRWNCRYRVMDAGPQTALAVEALERGVRRRVLDAYEATLEAAFENDPAVYVVRRAQISIALHVGPAPNETALAYGWGARMGAEIVRAIGGNADAANVLRFEDQADYAAHFIADLLRGLAWQRWCYGAFAKYRLAPAKEAILAILIEHPRELAAIFRYLAGLGCLKAVLGLLDDEAASKLWREAVRPEVREPASGEFRMFVRAALEIAAALGLGSAQTVDESGLLDAYIATGPRPADWTDRRALAGVVWSILRFARRRGYLAVPASSLTEERWTAQRARLAAALDWLDYAWLEQMLAAWPREDAGNLSPQPRIGSPAGAPTPNQRRLLERLRQILSAAVVALDRGHADSESNAMRLYATLAAAEPELAAHPATASMLALLLAAWKALLLLEDPLSALQQIRSGRVAAPGSGLPRESSEALAAASSLGEPAANVLQELLVRHPIALHRAAENSIETGCAGLFLLVRAITETRLASMVARSRKEPEAADLTGILLALGMQWGGGPAVRAGLPDPGLALWCGLAEPKPVATLLETLDPALCESLLAQIAKLIADRSSLDPAIQIAGDVPAEWTAMLTESWPTGAPPAPALQIAGIHLLRLWARWLRGIAHSSVPYLLRNLVRRSGRIDIRADEIHVKMRPAPLDAILEMSGYLAPTPAISWLGDRRVSFRIERAPS